LQHTASFAAGLQGTQKLKNSFFILFGSILKNIRNIGQVSGFFWKHCGFKIIARLFIEND